MNKKRITFISLLIINTSSYGMKRDRNNEIFTFNNHNETFTFNSHDAMPLITKNICSYHHDHYLDTIKNSMQALSQINKFFHNYYDQEATKQQIIRLCSHHLNSNDKDVAYKLKCHKILQKIEYFTNVALNKKKQFTADDLKEEWYLNMHTNFFSNFLEKNLQHSLLQITINHSELKKVNDILDNTKELTFRYNKKENLLCNITEKYAALTEDFFIDNQRLKDLLFIARRLLEKNILVDGRTENTQYTPLMLSVEKQNRPLVRLLLEYNADPYAQYNNTYDKKTQNAFDMEEEKGWLQKIINEVKANKEKQLSANTIQ